jgi:short subunit dehydrogenase-like uncharacterized protein
MTVVLYGATGYTGRLVAQELARGDVPRVLSGRDPVKLARLGEEQSAPVRAVGLDDEHGLRELLAEASVVINCAGPFTLAGDAVARAAVDTGTHYVAAQWTVVADAHGEDGSRGRAVVRGRDVYGITATILVHAAELLRDPGFDRAGTLAPAEAFEARDFLDQLSEHGVAWERSESLPLEHVL